MFCSTFECSTIVKCQLFYHAYTMRHVLHHYRSDPILLSGLPFNIQDLAKRGKVFVQTFAADAYFSSVFQFCFTGNFVLKKQNVFPLHCKNTFCFLKQCFPYGKIGKPRKNMRSANVSRNMYPRFFKVFSKKYQTLTDKTGTQINLFSMGQLIEIVIFNGLVN